MTAGTEYATQLMAERDALRQENGKLREALAHISDLARQADGVVGFVDFPHTKAVRAASKIAAAALSPTTPGTPEAQ